MNPNFPITPGSLSALNSMDLIKSKMDGHELKLIGLEKLLSEIVSGELTPEHTACFLTTCRLMGLSTHEVGALTRAMVNIGDCLNWDSLGAEKIMDKPIMDKHCVGGVPGNRTTPIVVSIVAANGLIIPKTSSRAITSPSGTADTMEVLTRVDLNMAEMRRVVELEGGCIVWGGAMTISPADRFLIQVEKKLGLGILGQMVASILSKKIGAGASHILIDIPVGPAIKINSELKAHKLSRLLKSVGDLIGLQLLILESDGTRPIGRGIGPALEARDVLSVLNNKNPPEDLKNKALDLAGKLLELGGVSQKGQGLDLAKKTLETGLAWKKFEKICEAQGGLNLPKSALYTHTVFSDQSKKIQNIDCSFFSQLAKLAGAPNDKEAGVDLHISIGDWVQKEQPLFTLHANSKEFLEIAKQYSQNFLKIF